MQFTAEIVPGSIIEKKWLQIRRVGGFVNTVYFAKHGTHFYSSLLSDSEVQKIKDNPYVNLIVMSAAPRALGEGGRAIVIPPFLRRSEVPYCLCILSSGGEGPAVSYGSYPYKLSSTLSAATNYKLCSFLTANSAKYLDG